MTVNLDIATENMLKLLHLSYHGVICSHDFNFYLTMLLSPKINHLNTDLHCGLLSSLHFLDNPILSHSTITTDVLSVPKLQSTA